MEFSDDGVVLGDDNTCTFDLETWLVAHDPPRVGELFPVGDVFVSLTSERAPGEFTYKVVGPIESFAQKPGPPGFAKNEFAVTVSENFVQQRPGVFMRRRTPAA